MGCDRKQLFLKKHFFLVGYCVQLQRTVFFQSTVFLYFMKIVATIQSSMDTVFFKRVLAAKNCAYEIYLTDVSISGVLFFFKRSTCSHTFAWYFHCFTSSLAEIQYFQGYCLSLKQALAVIPFFKGIQLIRYYSCSHPFDE